MSLNGQVGRTPRLADEGRLERASHAVITLEAERQGDSMFSSQLVCGHQGGVPLDLGPLHFLDGLVGSEGSKGWLFFANDVIGHPNCSAPPLTPLTGVSPVPKKWKEGTRRGTRKSATIGAPARQRPRSSPRREQDCTSSQTIPTTPPTRNSRPPSTTAQFSLQTIDRLGGTTFAPLLHGFLHPVNPSIPTLPHSKKGTFHPVSWLHWVGSSLARR